jgi:predicted amino acid-binding ACT domain protein
MFKMFRVHVYHAPVDDKPGGTATRLKALAEAGVHLEYVRSERADGKPGQGDLFVSPKQVKAEFDLVKAAGFHEVQEPIVMRFQGDDKKGLGGRVTMEWEKAGINLHGLMMTVLDGKFVGLAHFDTAEDANKAAQLLAELGTKD